jgi:hypothetical protein
VDGAVVADGMVVTEGMVVGTCVADAVMVVDVKMKSVSAFAGGRQGEDGHQCTHYQQHHRRNR